MSDFSDAIAEPRWYIAHTITGYENKVKTSLEKIVANRGLEHLIMEVQVPVEITYETVTKKSRKKDPDAEPITEVKEVKTKLYPCYVYIKMIMSDETWHVVRNITGVTGFVGPGSKPEPLTEQEVLKLGFETYAAVTLKYGVGDSVKINGGSLDGFVGVVQEISEDNKRVRVLVSMFGRETPIDMDASEVAPIE